MRIVTCPDELKLSDLCSKKVKVFLAGGISGCPDWQSEVIASVDAYPWVDKTAILINPRRADFDTSNLNMSKDQIDWERRHLEAADLVLFWFPKETLCPITLLELGKCMVTGKPLVVGTHAEYARRFDVNYQVKVEPRAKLLSGLVSDSFINLKAALLYGIDFVNRERQEREKT